MAKKKVVKKKVAKKKVVNSIDKLPKKIWTVNIRRSAFSDEVVHTVKSKKINVITLYEALTEMFPTPMEARKVDVLEDGFSTSYWMKNYIAPMENMRLAVDGDSSDFYDDLDDDCYV